jgi:hypothetical protein
LTVTASAAKTEQVDHNSKVLSLRLLCWIYQLPQTLSKRKESLSPALLLWPVFERGDEWQNGLGLVYLPKLRRKQSMTAKLVANLAMISVLNFNELL